jgi:hypothetical protein
MEFRKFLIAIFVIFMIANYTTAKPLEGEDTVETDETKEEATTDEITNELSSTTGKPAITTTAKARQEAGSSAPSFMKMKLIPFISVALLYATMSKFISV